MIELVFVIVILGILAAVAIPKLSATRDDAYAAKIGQSVATAATEIASHAISSGKMLDDLSQMSNVVESMVASGTATLDILNRAVDFKVGSTSNCLRIEVVTSGLDENLTIVENNSSDSQCNSLQSIFDASAYPIALKGERVVY
jgi:general secretion pathway protein G